MASDFLIDRNKTLTGCQAQKPGARPDSSTLYEGCVAHALDGAYAARQGALSGLRTPKGCRGSNGRPFNPYAGRPFVRRKAPRGDGGTLLQVSARRGEKRTATHLAARACTELASRRPQTKSPGARPGPTCSELSAQPNDRWPRPTANSGRRHRLDRHSQLPKLILGVKFSDGLEVVARRADREPATAAA